MRAVIKTIALACLPVCSTMIWAADVDESVSEWCNEYREGEGFSWMDIRSDDAVDVDQTMTDSQREAYKIVRDEWVEKQMERLRNEYPFVEVPSWDAPVDEVAQFFFVLLQHPSGNYDSSYIVGEFLFEEDAMYSRESLRIAKQWIEEELNGASVKPASDK